MRYQLFIGRFQPPHNGHIELFQHYLSKEEAVLIAIRDIQPDDKNPLFPFQVQALMETIFESEVKSGMVKVIIIPDIIGFNYGRDVGYRIGVITAPASTDISATAIRESIRSGNEEWKSQVHPSIHKRLEELLKTKNIPGKEESQ